MTKLLPEILWAQRKDKLYLTVDLQDCESPTVKVTNDSEETTGRFDFTGSAGGHDYECGFDLMAAVKPDDAQISCTPRHIFVILPKKEEGDYWPRLTKEKGKNPHIKVDWTKYIDQDEEEAGEDSFRPDLAGMGGLGDMGMGGAGGMGGMGGMDMAQLQEMMKAQTNVQGDDGEEDSDDDELPDLEA